MPLYSASVTGDRFPSNNSEYFLMYFRFHLMSDVSIFIITYMLIITLPCSYYVSYFINECFISMNPPVKKLVSGAIRKTLKGIVYKSKNVPWPTRNDVKCNVVFTESVLECAYSERVLANTVQKQNPNQKRVLETRLVLLIQFFCVNLIFIILGHERNGKARTNHDKN